ncbi:MAG: hypothetical protein QHC40_08255 [Sphingobium sp.]|nr:hypothetical protein [Sphingobium sp.]
MLATLNDQERGELHQTAIATWCEIMRDCDEWQVRAGAHNILSQLEVIRYEAEEPGSRVRAEKYGMPIEYAHRIVERHFGVLNEKAALAGAQHLYQIKQSKVLREASERRRQLTAPVPPAPVTPS